MSVSCRFFTYLITLIAFLFSICLFRVLIYFKTPNEPDLCTDSESHRSINGTDAIYGRFADAIRIQTITKAEKNYNTSELLRFHTFLEKNFPLIHKSPFVKKQTMNKYSLFYTVNGSDHSLRPYMLCAHLDVVPVMREYWNVDPFAGQVRDGYIYGRGAVDTKHTLMAIMESLEFLLANGFKPKRTFYLAFGHDEEGSGVDGAAYMAKVIKYKLKEYGGQLHYLLDEGTMILNITVKGFDKQIAIVSVTEKGCVSLKVEAKGSPGHSSLPMEETAIVKLSKALSKFNSKAFPSLFGYSVEKDLLEAVAPHVSFPFKFILSNLWLFGPLVSYVLSFHPIGNGLIRTSTAVTMVDGGLKPNVLPTNAYAVINHRIHPLQSVKDVIDFDKRLINDDSIAISIHETASEPHPISPYNDNTFGYQAIKRSVREVYPNTIVVPGVLIASTDTKWYLDLTSNIYRFSSSIMRPEDLPMIHGHNERILLNNYIQIINFYHHLMLISDNEVVNPIQAVKDEL